MKITATGTPQLHKLNLERPVLSTDENMEDREFSQIYWGEYKTLQLLWERGSC